MVGPPSTAHPSTLTSPPDPDHHAVPDPRRANSTIFATRPANTWKILLTAADQETIMTYVRRFGLQRGHDGTPQSGAPTRVCGWGD